VAVKRAAAADSDRLALLVTVGDLVVALDALRIVSIRRAAETAMRKVDANLFVLDLEPYHVPGWDLGELLALGPCSTAWVIIEQTHAARSYQIALRVGRCIAVRKLPETRRIPNNAFGARRGALAAAFTTAGIPEVPDAPTGVLIDLAHLLTSVELDTGIRACTSRGTT
jgi:hypothetical protein